MPHPIAMSIFWLAVALCVVAQIAIVRASVAPAREDVHGAGMPKPARGAELVWVIIPALMLALVLLWTWRAIGHASHGHSRTLDAPVHAWHGGPR